jgi:plastocyanin
VAHGLPFDRVYPSQLRIVTRLGRRVSAALLVVVGLADCSKEPAPPKQGQKATAAPTATKIDDSAAGTVDLGTAAYHAVPLTAVGNIAGTITRDGSAPLVSDTATGTPDKQICGKKVETVTATTSKGLANAVVWVTDAASGKALPIERRIELSSEECALDPRVQAAVAGTTVNVENDDKVLHKFIFTHLGKHDTLTVVRFFNAGEVVASERIAKTAGIVEVRCTLHPWTRGYVAVFDHPYFAVTEKNGSFTIDSLPPGSYHVMVWHEGAAKPVEQTVQVAAGGTSRMDMTVRVDR